MISKDFRPILSSELISVTGGLMAGLMLTFATNKIDLIPGLLILLPGFLEMRGNISGSLSARLSSGLFVHAVQAKYRKNDILRGNVIASMILVVALSFFLGVLTYYIGVEFFGISNPNIILIAVVAGILSNIIEIPLTVAITFWLFRHGHDPNNVMGPYITTTGDIVSIFSLLVAIAVV